MSRRLLATLALAVALLVTVPLAVMAASGGGAGRLDHQRFKFRVGDITTSSKTFHDVQGLSRLFVCARRAVSATVSVTARGGPFALRVNIDDDGNLHPGQARFQAGRHASSFSYTFVGAVGPFEADDGHSFAVQWRSVTGAPVEMRRGTVDLLFQDGSLGSLCQ
jgi:hypothetical protein